MTDSNNMVTGSRSSTYALADLALALTRSSSRVEGVCETAARAAAEMLGDGAAVQLVGDDELYGAMIAYHPDAERARTLAEALTRRGAPPEDQYSQSMRATRRPVVLSPLTPARLAELAPSRRSADRPGERAGGAGISAAVLCPLIADNKYLGYLLVARTAPNGTYTEADGDLVRDIAGELSLALATARSMERLRVSEDRFRRVLESIPEGVLQIDATGVTTFANQPCAGLLGLSREQLVGLPLSGFLDDRGQRHLARWLAGSTEPIPGPPLPGGAPDPATAGIADARVVRADGSTRSVRLCLTVLQEDQGHPGSSLCLVTDRTEQVDARGLKRQLDHLRRLDSMGQLIGGIAHDLNNLLTIVGGSADMIAGTAEPGSPQHQLAAEIVHATVKGRALAHQLLAFGRGGSRPETIRVPDLLEDIKPLFARTLGEHIHLDFSHDPEVWPVRAERGPLQQILVNLAANARDAMLHGGVLTAKAGNVVVAPGDMEDRSVTGRFVRLTIADTGGGMDEHTRQRAMEAFFTTKSGAVGLGLSTAMSVLRGIGGYISLQSEPRIGTTVQLYLPAIDAAPPAPAVEPPPTVVPGPGRVTSSAPATTITTPATSGDGGWGGSGAPGAASGDPAAAITDPGPMGGAVGGGVAATGPDRAATAATAAASATRAHVLVVEDQPELAQLIRRLLEPAGYTVTVSTDAETAVDSFASVADPALLITDVVMPGVTGPDLADAMRARHPGLPVLFMSGYTAAALGPQVHLDANSALVEKPFNRSTLLAAVERFTPPAP
jgi:signal transduction histidine kinase/ActR/RegA family two-component response regulator